MMQTSKRRSQGQMQKTQNTLIGQREVNDKEKKEVY